MDRKALILHELIDKMLDSVGEGLSFVAPSNFENVNVVAKEQGIMLDERNLAVYNRRQSLVPRLTQFVICSIRAERDRFLKVIKGQIEGTLMFVM
jgi:hypothetical protein